MATKMIHRRDLLEKPHGKNRSLPDLMVSAAGFPFGPFLLFVFFFPVVPKEIDPLFFPFAQRV